MPGSVCNIELKLADLSGVWTCTPQGTLPLGATCDAAGSGDAACASNTCATATVMDLLTVGTCSECDPGNPCDPAETCSAPEVELDGTIVPGLCQ
ncbi:MAG: hypothetical protein KUG77_15690 [Nannocystaceae bacterium]|nr:hypothetical protein [Nannocystaceae bacterium]